MDGDLLSVVGGEVRSQESEAGNSAVRATLFWLPISGFLTLGG
jgi:hypothetical protein